MRGVFPMVPLPDKFSYYRVDSDCDLQQRPKDQLISMYEVLPRIEIGPIHAISITDHKVGSFSDTSLGHKIFSHGRIFALLQISNLKKAGPNDPAYAVY
jgi:hypothetical protein